MRSLVSALASASFNNRSAGLDKTARAVGRHAQVVGSAQCLEDRLASLLGTSAGPQQTAQSPEPHPTARRRGQWRAQARSTMTSAPHTRHEPQRRLRLSTFVAGSLDRLPALTSTEKTRWSSSRSGTMLALLRAGRRPRRMSEAGAQEGKGMKPSRQTWESRSDSSRRIRRSADLPLAKTRKSPEDVRLTERAGGGSWRGILNPSKGD